MLKDFCIAFALAILVELVCHAIHAATGYLGPTDYASFFGITFGAIFYSRHPILKPRGAASAQPHSGASA